jgi:hypothetical protein
MSSRCTNVVRLWLVLAVTGVLACTAGEARAQERVTPAQVDAAQQQAQKRVADANYPEEAKQW